jgi:hypothetical protein
MKKLEADITDIKGDTIGVTDCTLVNGWVHFRLNGKKCSSPNDKIVLIRWRED